MTKATDDIDIIVDRVTAVMLVRLVALVSPLGTYKDLSASTICRAILTKGEGWPDKITDAVIQQLRGFVHKIISGYKDVPYHNRQHATHVILSANKLLDMMLQNRRNPSFGLRNDPLALMAQLFSALIHDVEHQGIPNRQLALEDDRLAILYNDVSIAENWSIYIAFSEFLQDDYEELRKIMFVENEEYFRFRKMVIAIVLSTDIASPERTQLVKSKWKEAFGDPHETIERKIRAQNRRASLGMTGKEVPSRFARRMTGNSVYSELSHDAVPEGGEDSSDTLTPENSDHEDDLVQGVSSRRMSKGFGSAHSKFERRMSAASNMSHRKRLGIQRAIDLSGEVMENYSSRRASTGTFASASSANDSIDFEADDPSELKASVVMETIMTAADVAHNLQSWDHMAIWSSRLYLELRRALMNGRGSDPEPRWFENQIGFLESYLLPLSRRLEDTGVFGEAVGESFSKIVEGNRDKWLIDGFDVTQKTIQDGAEKYPIEK